MTKWPKNCISHGALSNWPKLKFCFQEKIKFLKNHTFGHTPLELATEVSKWYILKFDVVMVIKQFYSLNYAELCLCTVTMHCPFFIYARIM